MTTDAAYQPFPFQTDADAWANDAVQFLQDNLDGWEPSAAHLETLIIAAMSRIAAIINDTAAQTSQGVFDDFGALNNITRIQAAHATTASTWTVQDGAGYVIPAGTAVAYRRTGDNLVVFNVTNDVTIQPGSPSSAPGEVTLIAIDAGIDYNNVPAGATLEVLDPLAFVMSALTTQASSGGADAETDLDYRNRLAQEFQLLTPKPILARDYATLARRQPGVYRSFGIAGYNPANGTSNNPGYVGVALVDSSGNPVPLAVKAAVVNYLSGLREANIQINTVDPTYTAVSVQVSLHVTSGYDPAIVQAAVQNEITAYLAPANWGGGDATPPTWDPTATVVRYFRMSSVLESVPGVDYITVLRLNNGTSDVTLLGAAPLPQVGSVQVTLV